MSVPPALLDQVFTRKLFAVAGSSLLYYDYLLTFSHEVADIWDGKWTLVKALFLANRYGNLIGQTFILLEETGNLAHNSHKFCVAYEIFCACFGVFSGESIRLLVVMRACAILGCKRNVTIVVIILYALCGVVILALSLYSIGNLNYYRFPNLDVIKICSAPLEPHFWSHWFIPLFFDNLVLVVVSCSLYHVTGWSRGHGLSRLVRLLARDAFLFYFTALFNVLFFMVSWNVYRLDPRNAIPTVFSFALISVVGQRIVLNLRRFRSEPGWTDEISREVHRQVATLEDAAMGSPLQFGVELSEFEGKSGELASRTAHVQLCTNEGSWTVSGVEFAPA